MSSKDLSETGRAKAPSPPLARPPLDPDNSISEPGSPASPTAPRQQPRSRLAPPPAPSSVISSRMTDIDSDDDGIGAGPDAGLSRRSIHTSDLASRPPTALTGVTGVSSSRSAYQGPGSPPQPLRKHALTAHKRRSTGAGSIASSIERAGSVKSKSHVPTLTSHAFFRPMSSQKLQAQRAQGRQPSFSVATDDGFAVDETASGAVGEGHHAVSNLWRRSLASSHSQNQNPIARFTSEAESHMQPPGSRGTEITGFDAIDRLTNASPAPGNRMTGSITDSTRPLYGLWQGQGSDSARQQQNNLGTEQEHRIVVVDTSRSFRDHRSNAPSSIRPPPFGSSFGLFGLDEAPPRPEPNHGAPGAEKLSSSSSATASPRVRPVDLKDPATLSRHTARSRREELRRRGRVHQYFEGNTFFCLGGRFQNSRQKPLNMATGTLIVVPCVLFYVFEASWHWHNISPAIPIVFAYLSYLCFSSFLHASVSDPGILPRNLHPFPPQADPDDPFYIPPPTNDWTLVKSIEHSTAAMEVPVKHCRTCNIWRPPRAHHCRLCDNCIEGHDHHCVWLNNCVGRRNYRFFFVFVGSATLLGLYLFGVSLAKLLVVKSRTGVSFGSAVGSHRVAFALLIMGLLGFAYPAALMGYHMFLTARGETTREFINSHKFARDERYRAFTQGSWARNWVAVLCRPRPPTYYGFKRRYQVGDQRLATRKRVAWLEPPPPPRPPGAPQAVEMQTVKPAATAATTAATTTAIPPGP